MCLWKTDAPDSKRVQYSQKPRSPTFWHHVHHKGTWWLWGVDKAKITLQSIIKFGYSIIICKTKIKILHVICELDLIMETTDIFSCIWNCPPPFIHVRSLSNSYVNHQPIIGYNDEIFCSSSDNFLLHLTPSPSLYTCEIFIQFICKSPTCRQLWWWNLLQPQQQFSPAFDTLPLPLYMWDPCPPHLPHLWPHPAAMK